MEVLMVCHSFTSTWQGARILRWSLGSLDVAFACYSFLISWYAWEVRLFVKSACSFVHSSMNTSLHDRPFVCEHIFLHASFVHPFTNRSSCMYSPCSTHPSSCHVCLCTCISSHSWRDDIKSINLLVYHDAWSFQMQTIRTQDKVMKLRKESFNMGWRLWELLVKTT